jgi:hypothetical protein
MSSAARTALINVGTNRQGAMIPALTPQAAIDELSRLGLIGRNLGLTRKGTIKREQISLEELDSMF